MNSETILSRINDSLDELTKLSQMTEDEAQLAYNADSKAEIIELINSEIAALNDLYEVALEEEELAYTVYCMWPEEIYQDMMSEYRASLKTA